MKYATAPSPQLCLYVPVMHAKHSLYHCSKYEVIHMAITAFVT